LEEVMGFIEAVTTGERMGEWGEQESTRQRATSTARVARGSGRRH
jgi:hypothetical protein